MKLEERRPKGQLNLLRDAKGLELLRLAGERPDQLSFLDEED